MDTICLHPDVQRSVSEPDDTVIIKYVCQGCEKHLVTTYSNISATWSDISDKPWADKCGIKELEYN